LSAAAPDSSRNPRISWKTCIRFFQHDLLVARAKLDKGSQDALLRLARQKAALLKIAARAR